MNKNRNSNEKVPVTIANVWHYLLHSIVHFFIQKQWCQQVDKFKPGDYVMYNWKAKHYIGKTYTEEKGVRRIKSLTNYNDGSQGCSFEGDGGGDVFWLKKASQQQILNVELPFQVFYLYEIPKQAWPFMWCEFNCWKIPIQYSHFKLPFLLMTESSERTRLHIEYIAPIMREIEYNCSREVIEKVWVEKYSAKDIRFYTD